MIIAIPADRADENSSICISYGRTLFFALYDSDTKKVTFLSNSANAAAGGAGIKASQMLIDNGVTDVITPRLGENAAMVLNAAGIKIYRAEIGGLMPNIQALLDGKLQFLTNIHKGFHGRNN